MKQQTVLSRIMRSPATSWILLVAVLVLLLVQAYHPWWRGHLEVDIATFHARAKHFLTGHTWTGMDYNEYQPGALWFFVLIGYFTANIESFDAFLTMAILVNAVLIGLHFAFFKQYGSRYAPLLFLGLVAASGPILLYRFELLVSILTLAAWILMRKGWLASAALMLGLATSIKLYPIVLFPLLLIAPFHRRDWTEMARTSLFFLVGLLLPVALAVEFGASLGDILQSIHVHQLKPVSPEGFWGDLITIWQYLAGIPLRVTPGYGVFGISSDLPMLQDMFLNNIWMVCTAAVLLYIFGLSRKHGSFDPGFAFVVLLTFVYFSKVVNPQYLWWFMCFLPLVSLSGLRRQTRRLIVWSALGSLLLTQIVYPLYYSEFLDWFNGSAASPRVFTVMVIRNLVLLLLLGCGLYRLSRLPGVKKGIS